MITEALVLSAILFVIGTFGVLVRRNAIIMFLCIELQLNAVNLSFVAFSRVFGIDGQIFVFFVMTVAAAEAAVGLAISSGGPPSCGLSTSSRASMGSEVDMPGRWTTVHS